MELKNWLCLLTTVLPEAHCLTSQSLRSLICKTGVIIPTSIDENNLKKGDVLEVSGTWWTINQLMKDVLLYRVSQVAQ